MSHADFANLTLVDHPLIRVRLTTLRDKNTGTEAFRKALHDVAQLTAYEITGDLELNEVEVETPLVTTTGAELARPLVLVPILRAGVGLLNGFSGLLSEAIIGHIGMYRDERTLEAKSYYANLPAENLSDSDVILIDPMLATGASSAAAAAQLKQAGAARIRFVSLIAAPEGVRHFAAAHPDIAVYTAALDEGLDENAYIVPGLGDAGDRYFGA